MTQSITRRLRSPALSVAAALLLTLALAGVATARTASAITISDLTPASGSTIAAGQPVVVSGFISTDSPIALINNRPDVTVLIDGAQVTPEFVVGSRAVRVGFRVSHTFSPGNHTVQVTARSVGGETSQAQSTFTAAQEAAAATTTPTATTAAIPATTTRQLPAAGGVPASLAYPLLLGLGAATAGIGLRLRAR